MNLLRTGFLALLLATGVSAADSMRGYYAPPPEWMPEKAIRDYSANTRVPDLTRIEYDAAYAMALRIRPVAAEKLKNQLDAGVIPAAGGVDILKFRPEAEKDAANRRIVIRKLGIPADEFVELSFKMKTKARNTEGAVTVSVPGVTLLDTSKHADPATTCRDGFQAYRVGIPVQKGRILQDIIITVPAASGADFEQEYTIIDFMFKRSTPVKRFAEELPPRQWIRKADFANGRFAGAASAIPDVFTFVRSPEGKAFESLPLPFNYELRKQTEKEKDGGFRTEIVREKVAGKETDVLKIHLKKGPRCYLKFPVEFDGVDFNVMTFAAKVEVSGGGAIKSRFIGEHKPELFGADAAKLNAPYDTFSFGVTSASHDHADWMRYGVSQGNFAFHAGKSGAGGWRQVALDFVNDDYAGTKGTYNSRITHWCVYYGNAKLPDEAEVVISIADPRMTKGLMHAGGDMALYKKFLEEKEQNPLFGGVRASSKLPAFGGAKAERLAKPLGWIRDRAPQGEIIIRDYGCDAPYNVIVDRAVETMQKFFAAKYTLTQPFAVLSAPSEAPNAKLFIGGSDYAKVDPAQYAADMEKLAGSPGCAIRAHGNNIYIYAAPQPGYSGAARGLANGIYTFLENNTDVIMAYSRIYRWQGYREMVFDVDQTGNMDLVWGNGYVNRPPFDIWGISGDAVYNDFNRAAFYTVWGNWEYGGARAWATNHCWSYGTEPNGKGAKPNETWGIDENGKPMVPGCYTGHPCLVNVLEKAKESYLQTAFRPVKDNKQHPPGKSFVWNTSDIMGMSVEDTLNVCHCPRCATPIRLADGSLLKRSDTDFLSTQFFENACAMIHAVNVYAHREMKVESIAYFWMTNVPAFELPRNYRVRFCPYIRKNYFAPIYAPCNDLFWRSFLRWKGNNAELAEYEYFLQNNFRPYADIFRYDINEERKLGIRDILLEGDLDGVARAMEQWVVTRLLWEPDRTPAELRSYFLRRTFREAGPDMEKFHAVFYNAVYKDFAPYQSLEFEDMQQLGVMALRGKTPSGMTVAEEMDKHLGAAERAVKNPVSGKLLKDFRTEWDRYLKAAQEAKSNE